MTAIHVLHIDDEPVFRRLIEARANAVKPERFKFVPAETLADGIQATEGADVVLLDLGLPDCEGIKTVEKFCSAAPHLPVIVMTARNTEQLLYDCVEHGAVDCFSKNEFLILPLLKRIRAAVLRERFLANQRAKAS